MRISIAWSLPIASRRMAALAAVSGSAKLMLEQLQPILEHLGRLVDRDVADDAHVAADVVFVAGVERRAR